MEFAKWDDEAGFEEGFKIDTDVKADWAVRKIKDAAEERDRLLALVAERMTELEEQKAMIEEKYEKDTEWLKGQLWIYCQQVKTKDTKTQSTYQLLSGKLKIKRGGIDYKRDNEELLKWAKDSSPEFVKVKTDESIDWAALKKTVSVYDGNVISNETGEVIPGITPVQKEDTFEVEF